MTRTFLDIPRYQCHKQVRACKIAQVVKHAHPDPKANDAEFEASPAFEGAHLFLGAAGTHPVPVDANWYRKHNPEAGGYYVVYDDGYTSYSPAKAFEEGYTRIDVPVPTAIRELATHKVNGCNECIVIEVMDGPGSGGASHEYRISGLKGPLDHHPIPTIDIRFQKGPLKECGANGITQEALIAIVMDRLQSFQAGSFACNENMHALVKLTEAMQWLQSRTRARVSRGVEGTHAK